MYIYLGEPKALDFLARTACEIEIDRLKKRIGKKDRSIAAYGGFREVLFERGSNCALPCWGGQGRPAFAVKSPHLFDRDYTLDAINSYRTGTAYSGSARLTANCYS
jgi:hypothetical protein